MSVRLAEISATRNALGFLLTQKAMIQDVRSHEILDGVIRSLNRGNPPMEQADACFVEWVVLSMSNTKAVHNAAFKTALKIGHTEAVKALVMHGELSSYDYLNQYLLASQHQKMPMVRAFLETGKMAPGFCDQAFRQCCERRDLATLKSLSINPISAQLFAAHYNHFVQRGDLEMVVVLNSFEQAEPLKNPSPATTESIRTDSASPYPEPLIGRMDCEEFSHVPPWDLLDGMPLFHD